MCASSDAGERAAWLCVLICASSKADGRAAWLCVLVCANSEADERADWLCVLVCASSKTDERAAWLCVLYASEWRRAVAPRGARCLCVVAHRKRDEAPSVACTYVLKLAGSEL